MTVYLMRHAREVRREDSHDVDAARPLSDKGRRDAKNAARFLAHYGAIDLILSSPYERAVETAHIVRKGLELEEQPSTDARIGPGFNAGRLDALLDKHGLKESILIIGHEPDLTRILEELAGASNLKLEKGGIVRLDLDPNAWKCKVEWLLTPELYGT